MHRILRLGVALLLGGSGGLAAASDPMPSELQIKAVYLNGYAQFVTWPDESFSPPDSGSLKICVIGDDPFGDSLTLATRNESSKGHPIQVEVITALELAPSCHVLYVSESERIRQGSILAAVRGKPVLTVSDIEHFVERGGMIQFYKRDNKVRFFIDPESVREVGLKPNANLLRISDIVQPNP